MIYEPSDDSYLLQKQIKNYVKGKSVLDMGAASGIISESAAKAGAKSILAADIQQDVIKNLSSKKIPCIKSDLFLKIKGKFDVITFNPPYLPEDGREDNESKIVTTGGKKGDEIILRFLKQARLHLNENGKILIVISSLTPKKRIKKLFNSLKLTYKKIAEKKLFFETLEVWEIRN